MSRRFTHARGVELARRWLARRCPVVITEMATGNYEEPDAIGWRGARSILVEVKAARADFCADARKPFRRWPEFGMGEQRHFLTPPGLVTVDELPAGWGLLEVGPRGGIREVCPPTTRDAYCWQSEVRLLLSTVRRIGHEAPSGVSIRCYTSPTKARATLTCKEVDE